MLSGIQLEKSMYGGKMLKSKKHVFWEALLVTVLLFGLGVFLGIILENWRGGKINTLAQKSEISLLDIRVQEQIYSQEEFNCEVAIEENLKFADKIFEEAKVLDRYESASRLTEDIRVQHTKYDILRAMLLLNSMKIKEKCNASYYEVVYFYNYNKNDLNLDTKQNTFSRLLAEVKEKKGSDVLLIPIAADNDLSSVNLLLDKYEVELKDVPVIVINEKIKISEITKIDDLIKYFE